MKMLRIFSLCGFTAMLAVCSLCQAQTLEEWKTARDNMKAGRGCDSIPYSNYRDSCNRSQALVNENCGDDDNGDGDKIEIPWNCSHLRTRPLREEIRGMSQKIESLKSEKDHASNDKERSESLEREIERLSKEVEFRQKSLETDIKDIEIRLDRGRRCIDARQEVRSNFRSAKSNASNVRDGEAGQIAKELVESWESKETGHDHAIDMVRKGIEKCDKCKSGDL
jgi:hypothetical protein